MMCTTHHCNLPHKHWVVHFTWVIHYVPSAFQTTKSLLHNLPRSNETVVKTMFTVGHGTCVIIALHAGGNAAASATRNSFTCTPSISVEVCASQSPLWIVSYKRLCQKAYESPTDPGLPALTYVKIPLASTHPNTSIAQNFL